MKERDIKHESEGGRFWVGDTRRPPSYTVYRVNGVASYADSSYARTPDGLSLAVARCDYLARRNADAKATR